MLLMVFHLFWGKFRIIASVLFLRISFLSVLFLMFFPTMLTDEWNAWGGEGIHKQGFSWNRCFRQTHQSPLIGEFGNTQTRHRVSRTFNIWWKTIGTMEWVNLKRNEEMKHRQRHNGPEGWVHITSSNTNLDQTSFSKHLFQTSNQTSPSQLNLYSKYWPNLASAI